MPSARSAPRSWGSPRAPRCACSSRRRTPSARRRSSCSAATRGARWPPTIRGWLDEARAGVPGGDRTRLGWARRPRRSSAEQARRCARSARTGPDTSGWAPAPAAVLALTRMNAEIDVRPHPPSRSRSRPWSSTERAIGPSRSRPARFMAEHIPGASIVELPGDDHLPWVGDTDAVLGEVEEFLTGARTRPEPDRVLATVLFTDIVGLDPARRRARRPPLGRSARAHHADRPRTSSRATRRTRDRHGGRRVPRHVRRPGACGPLRARDRRLRCGRSASRSGPDSTPARCELAGDDIGGMAVHIGARIAALAGPARSSSRAPSRTSSSGSGLTFQDRGSHVLKGVPDEWQLFAAGN